MTSPSWKIALMVQIQTIYRSLGYAERLALSQFLLETAAKVSASADADRHHTQQANNEQN